MSEKPILFSGPMVRAILAGKKTQTRRIVKDSERLEFAHMISRPCRAIFREQREASVAVLQRIPLADPDQGDTLWVRENFALSIDGTVIYQADWSDAQLAEERRIRRAAPELARRYWEQRWRPSIHLRREHARLFLRVTAVRVERVQEISEADAIAEGIDESESVWGDYHIRGRFPCDRCSGTGLYLSAPAGAVAELDCRECDEPLKRFRVLWDSLNERRGYGWAVNPWVWVYEFERSEAPRAAAGIGGRSGAAGD